MRKTILTLLTGLIIGGFLVSKSDYFSTPDLECTEILNYYESGMDEILSTGSNDGLTEFLKNIKTDIPTDCWDYAKRNESKYSLILLWNKY